MIKTFLKYLLYEQCIEVFFQSLYRNFLIPTVDMDLLIRELRDDMLEKIDTILLIQGIDPNMENLLKAHRESLVGIFKKAKPRE